MYKKLIIIISFLLFVNTNLSIIASAKNNLIPLKKPKLTKQELKKKVLINILKPLPKPSSEIQNTPSKEIVENPVIKPKYILPKKKPLVAGNIKDKKAIKSKFYSKKDFSIAKKSYIRNGKSTWGSSRCWHCYKIY